MDELGWSPLLQVSDIGVTVRDGVVTLTGNVDSYAKKVEAQRCAERIVGVKAVAVDITVGISPEHRRTDTEIAEAVVKTLNMHTSIPENTLQVTVEDGTVTLEGEVEWEYQRAAAKNAIQHFAGVKNVWNFIRLKPRLAPKDIREKIKAAFERSAKIDAGRIVVTTYGTQVTLTGAVASLAEKEDAEYAAWSAPGVTMVINNLYVQEEAFAF